MTGHAVCFACRNDQIGNVVRTAVSYRAKVLNRDPIVIGSREKHARKPAFAPVAGNYRVNSVTKADPIFLIWRKSLALACQKCRFHLRKYIRPVFPPFCVAISNVQAVTRPDTDDFIFIRRGLNYHPARCEPVGKFSQPHHASPLRAARSNRSISARISAPAFTRSWRVSFGFHHPEDHGHSVGARPVFIQPKWA